RAPTTDSNSPPGVRSWLRVSVCGPSFLPSSRSPCSSWLLSLLSAHVTANILSTVARISLAFQVVVREGGPISQRRDEPREWHAFFHRAGVSRRANGDQTAPGLGQAPPSVVAAYKHDATRFQTCKQVEAYCGLVPRQHQSGSLMRSQPFRGPRSPGGLDTP